MNIAEACRGRTSVTACWLGSRARRRVSAARVWRLNRATTRGGGACDEDGGEPQCSRAWGRASPNFGRTPRQRSSTLGFTAPIFLLIGAAYAHDLGMTIFPGETERLLGSMGLTQTPGWETDEGLQRHLRQEHSKRGGEYIRENADALRVPTSLTGALDMMMRAHNMAIPELEEAREPYAAQERELDVRQLAAIVCTGDALEYSDTRVMEGVLDRIGRLIIRRQELLASACRTPLQRLATGRTELARMRDLEACALATEYQ
ncbi:HD domain-containing protein [Alicycliphilus denitrificans]|nr:hypothetical protein Alide_3474 [Alicycliphilus denitrificans BC]